MTRVYLRRKVQRNLMFAHQEFLMTFKTSPQVCLHFLNSKELWNFFVSIRGTVREYQD